MASWQFQLPHYCRTIGVFGVGFRCRPWGPPLANPNPNTTLVSYHLLKVRQLRVLPMEEKYGYLDRRKRSRYIRHTNVGRQTSDKSIA